VSILWAGRGLGGSSQCEAVLKRHSKAYEFHRYDGAGHGIFYYHTSM